MTGSRSWAGGLGRQAPGPLLVQPAGQDQQGRVLDVRDLLGRREELHRRLPGREGVPEPDGGLQVVVVMRTRSAMAVRVAFARRRGGYRCPRRSWTAWSTTGSSTSRPSRTPECCPAGSRSGSGPGSRPRPRDSHAMGVESAPRAGAPPRARGRPAPGSRPSRLGRDIPVREARAARGEHQVHELGDPPTRSAEPGSERLIGHESRAPTGPRPSAQSRMASPLVSARSPRLAASETVRTARRTGSMDSATEGSLGVERRPHHLGRDRTVADHDLDGRARLRGLDGHVAQPIPFPVEWLSTPLVTSPAGSP
jgi:hypothetical protein